MDFRKRLAGKKAKKLTEPVELYDTHGFEGLRMEGIDIFAGVHGERDHRAVATLPRLNTMALKTLVGR